MFDLAKEIWQTMRTNKLRTFLTGFSVAWGIFMLILLLALAKGVMNRAVGFAENNDPNRISVWGGRTSLPYQGLERGRRIELGEADLAPIQQADRQHISSVTASMSVSGIISSTTDYIAQSCSGVYPDYFTGRFKFDYGRPINQADIKQLRKTMVLPSTAAETLFGDASKAVGQIVKLGDIAFTVVGIYQAEWERTPFIPYTTAFALKGYPTKDVEEIIVHLQDVDNEVESGQVEQKVKESLAKTKNFDPADNSAVWTHDRFAGYIEQKQASGYLNYAMWAIGILTLITGIVGVSNIMFVSVRERTHEIGIRRAIGAKPRSILTQVVLESVALTTCFGYIGVVMGTFAVEVVKKVMGPDSFLKDPGVDISIAIEVTVALIIAGAIAGIFPAMRALKIKPVEALMEE